VCLLHFRYTNVVQLYSSLSLIYCDGENDEKLVAITLALAMALTLAACSNEDNNADDSTNAHPAATLGIITP